MDIPEGLCATLVLTASFAISTGLATSSLTMSTNRRIVLASCMIAQKQTDSFTTSMHSTAVDDRYMGPSDARALENRRSST